MIGGQPLDNPLTPLDVLRRWQSQTPVALLHSGQPDPSWSRYCILAQPEDAVAFDGRQFLDTRRPAQSCVDPFSAIQSVWDEEDQALWIGYIGYEIGRWIEQLPEVARDQDPWPIFEFQRCPGWLVYDQITRQWTGHGTWSDGAVLDRLPAVDVDQSWVWQAGDAQYQQTREAYELSVQRVKDYIAAGDVFQVNLAQRIAGSFSGNPRRLFTTLTRQSPAWYGAYLEPTRFTGHAPHRAVCSISPELFLQCDADRTVTTRPIKGTLPADQPRQNLEQSEKDAAELAMIVDLLRNDLGRVCEVGSIRVQQGRAIETHPTVHHGVATVTGRLSERHNLADLLRATMPGGSITGAPKVRAMQIIEELEPVRRGLYCGSIGWVRGKTMMLNIAIRTLQIEQARYGGPGRYHFSVGGGIVADSTPAAEYNETLAKAQTLLRGLNGDKNDEHPQHQAQQ